MRRHVAIPPRGVEFDPLPLGCPIPGCPARHATRQTTLNHLKRMHQFDWTLRRDELEAAVSTSPAPSPEVLRDNAEEVAKLLWRLFGQESPTRWGEWQYTMDGWQWVTQTTDRSQAPVNGTVRYALSSRLLLDHVRGRRRVAVWPSPARSRWLGFDVDAHNCLQRHARGTARELRRTLVGLGLRVFTCWSGGGEGYHLWVLFERGVEARRIAELGEGARALARRRSPATVEIAGIDNNGLSLPMGYRADTGVWEEWLDARELQPVADSVAYLLRHVRANSVEAFYRALDGMRFQLAQAKATGLAENVSKDPAEASEPGQRLDFQTARQEVAHLRANGLSAQGTRHKAMFLLAQWEWHVEGRLAEEIRAILEDFADRKLNGFSRSSRTEIARDIREIVRDVPRYPIRGELKRRKLSREEQAFVDSAPGQSGRTLTALIDFESAYSRTGTMGGVFSASQEQLAERAGCSDRTVRDHLGPLEAHRLIAVERLGNSYTRRASEYRILWPGDLSGRLILASG